MKRMLRLLLVLTLFFCFSGCAENEEQLAELESLRTELARYEKYDDIVNALESEDYQTAAELVEGMRMRDYTEAVAEGAVQEVQISAENWGDYFEVKEITQWQQNDLGQTTGFITHVCLVVREEYADNVVQEKTKVDFAWQALCSVKNCAVDLDNRIIHMENEFKSKTTTFGEPEIMRGTVSYDGHAVAQDWSEDVCVAAKIGEIVLIGEYNQSGNLKPVCYDYDDTAVTYAQGIFVFKDNGVGNGE